MSLERVSRTGRLELSSGQRRLWFLNRLSPGNPVYNCPMGWRLRGRLDVGALERAWAQVVSRHEVLRTRYEEGEGGVWQVVEDAAAVRLEVEECGSEEELLATSREEGRRGFDLERGPVFRVRLLRLGAEEHVMLLTVHHVAWDWWSMGVVERELGALYGASVRGEELELAALEVQYADYAAWQRRRLAGGELERGLAYWRERLAGMPGALEVPLDRPRPASGTSRGGVVRFELGGDLMRRLDKLSRKSRTTLYMTLLGAWQGLLSRYTGRADVVVGTPIANRTTRELEGQVGFFVNTLVLRTDLSGDPSLEEVVRRARATAVEAYEQAEVPFEQLVEELKPERDLSRSPLVQVTFQLQGVGRGLELEGLEVSRYLLGSTMARFDLELNVVESGAGYLVYAEELYERESMERLVGHWRRLLEAMVEQPSRPLSEVELLSEGELERYREWNRTEAAYERERCAHELFEEQARRCPAAVAIVCGDEELRYGELNARANRLAWRLRELGVGPEARVGLSLERGVEMVVGLLGVWKAGGAIVPLDPEHRPERPSSMEPDSGVSVLLTPGWLREQEPAIASMRDDDPEPGVSAANLACVIHTSGSTGPPKAVMFEHRALTNYLSWAARTYAGDGEPRCIAHSSPSLDGALTELLLPLVLGGRTVLLEPGAGEVLDWETLRAHGPRLRLLRLTPAQLRLLASRPPDDAGALCPEVLLTGGEELVGEAFGGLREAAPDAVVVREWGPAEAAVGSTSHAVELGAVGPGPVSPGWPIANTTVHVLDERMRLVPPGVEGELYVGGDGLARGYRGRAALTAERFLPDPFGAGGRLYRTGDRGRRAPDGRLELGGRVERRGLLEPEPGGGGGYAAPESEMERVLAGIFGEVLELERVGVEDKFFQLGGHSLMAMRVMMLIRETFGVELDLRKLFELQTVRALATAVEEAATDSVMAMSEEQALALLARLDSR